MAVSSRIAEFERRRPSPGGQGPPGTPMSPSTRSQTSTRSTPRNMTSPNSSTPADISASVSSFRSAMTPESSPMPMKSPTQTYGNSSSLTSPSNNNHDSSSKFGKWQKPKVQQRTPSSSSMSRRPLPGDISDDNDEYLSSPRSKKNLPSKSPSYQKVFPEGGGGGGGSNFSSFSPMSNQSSRPSPGGGNTPNSINSRNRPIPGGGTAENVDPNKNSSNYGKSLNAVLQGMRRPPSPGMGMMNNSGGGSGMVKRPPSPGMFNSNGNGNRRPPSPGMGGVAHKLRPPSPGRLSPAPPDIVTSQSTESHNSEVEKDTGNNDAGGAEVQVGEGGEKNNLWNLSPRDRFIFTKRATGVKPPAKIQVESQPTNPSGATTDITTKQWKPRTPMNENKSPLASPLKKKSSNPLRDNPLFMKRMAEVAAAEASDDEDSSDDEELEHFHNKAKKHANKMQEMKNIVAMAEKTTKSSKDDVKDDEGIVTSSGKEAEDFNSPIKFIDGPRRSNGTSQPLKTDTKSEENEDSMKPEMKRLSTAESSSENTPESPRKSISTMAMAEEVKRRRGKLFSNHKKVSSEKKREEEDEEESNPSVSASWPKDEKSDEYSDDDNRPGKGTAVDNDGSGDASIDESSSYGNSYESGKEPVDPDHDRPSSPAIRPREETIKKAQSYKASRETFLVDHLKKSDISSDSDSSESEETSTQNTEVQGDAKQEEPEVKSEANTPSRLSMLMKKRSIRTTGPRSTGTSSTNVAPSESSVNSEGNASRGRGRLPANKSRREMLTKMKGRISSRSPSPSPLIKKHGLSPRRLREKTHMQKMIDARSKSAQAMEIGDDSSVASSKAGKNLTLPGKLAKSPIGRKDSASSLHSVPSDEMSINVIKGAPQGIAQSISTGSEHLSVKKGLNLIQRQNASLNSFRKEGRQESPGRAIPNVVTNRNRLLALKEQRMKRQERMEEKLIELKNDEEPVSPFGNHAPNESWDDYDDEDDDGDLSLGETSPAVDDDDDFSIDNMDVNGTPTSESAARKGKKSPKSVSRSPRKDKKTMRSHSPWAKVMQERLKNNAEDQEYDDQFHNESWTSDVSSPGQPSPSNKSPRQKSPKRAFFGEDSPQSSPEKSVTFLTEPNEESEHTILPGDNGASNAFVGPFEELLPRHTSPYFVRISEPTFPTSLLTTSHLQSPEDVIDDDDAVESHRNNKHELHIKDSNQAVFFESEENLIGEDVVSAGTSIQNDEGNQFQETWQDENFIEERQDYSRDIHQNGYTNNVPVSQNVDVEKLNHDVNNGDTRTSSPQDRIRVGNMPHAEDENKKFSSSTIQQGETKSYEKDEKPSFFEKDDQSAFVESTLLGQAHLPSDDEETHEPNQNSESIAQWWENSYAPSQNDEVNSDIKQALSQANESYSRSNDIDSAADSDEDVFFGLDEDSPKSRQQKRGNTRPMTRGKLETIPSEDDSDFDEIMNENPQGGKEDRKRRDMEIAAHLYATNQHQTFPPPPPPDHSPPRRAHPPSKVAHKNKERVPSYPERKLPHS